MNRPIYYIITALSFVISLSLKSYATGRTPPPSPEVKKGKEYLEMLRSPPLRRSPSLFSLPKAEQIPLITLTSCEKETSQLVPLPEKTQSPIVKDIPQTIASPVLRGMRLPDPDIEETSSSSPTLCFYENCLDDPYEDIFLPSLPPSTLSSFARDDLPPSSQSPSSANSMIEVEYGLFTTYFLIDGSKSVPSDYSLSDDLRYIFEHYQTKIHIRGDIYKPLSSTPSIRVKNLSAGDMNLLLSTLNAVLLSPFNEKSIDALYLNNVEIDEACGHKLRLLLSQNEDLQNLWLEDCKIDDQAFDLIVQGVDKSHLRTFWLHDKDYNFSLPPLW